MKTGHWVSSILGTTPRVCIQGVNSIWGCSRGWACGEGKKWPHNCILPLLLVIICLWLCLIKLGGKKAKACMCFSKQRWTKGQETSGVLFSVVLMLQKRAMSRNYDKVLRCLTPRLAPWGHTYPDKAQPHWGMGFSRMISADNSQWSRQRCCIKKLSICLLKWLCLLDSHSWEWTTHPFARVNETEADFFFFP